MEVAETTLWDHKNPPTHESVKKLADEYFKIANLYLGVYGDHLQDEDLIIFAVKYLGHAHALPPLQSDKRWFDEKLDVILELCCPNIIHSKESA